MPCYSLGGKSDPFRNVIYLLAYTELRHLCPLNRLSNDIWAVEKNELSWLPQIAFRLCEYQCRLYVCLKLDP